tara:strand:- start:6628 stop:6909 length:282 start_codon:yes stop_codon:yes gene_type:complete
MTTFPIRGISFNQDNLEGINETSKFTMQLEPTNLYDNRAIMILYDGKKIGYVPKEDKFKLMCFKHLNNNLEVAAMGKVPGKNIIYINVKISQN